MHHLGASCYPAIIQGPFKVLFQTQPSRKGAQVQPKPQLPHSIRMYFDQLRTMLHDRCSDNPVALATCLQALEGIERAYRALAGLWPGRVVETAFIWKWIGLHSADFIGLLQKNHPPALVLLAHVVIFSRFCENQWYYRGWATNALQAIRNALDQEWTKRR
jgi:hypothetical protein